MTEFRRRMAAEFGGLRSEMLAQDHVFSELGARTADQALEEGMQPQRVWRAVCESFEIPRSRR